MSSNKLLNNRYRILARIGVGGMAVIYKAQDTLLDRYVAIKVLKEEFVHNEQFLKRFRREAQAAARLTHANIVNVFDVGDEDGLYYIVMELVEGKTLKEYIEERGCLTWKETLSIVLKTASALDVAHKNNIIHRDIKPQNILMNEEGVPKVTDFGIAKAVTSSTVTSSGDAMGSVHYVSPEQARGGFVDERSDLYSLGIMMYEMLTGILPYVGDTVVSIAIQHIQSNVPQIENVTPNIPQAVADVANRLTMKHPEKRYQNASEVMSAVIRAMNNPYESLEPVEENKKEKAMTAKTSVQPKAVEEGIILAQNPQNVAEVARPQKEERSWNEKIKAFFMQKNKAPLIVMGLVVVFIIAMIAYGLIANKKTEVPNLEGMTIEQMEETLDKAGLTYKIKEEKSSLEVPKGSIISQNPKAGEYIKKTLPVEVVVSLGPKMIVMPDVVGQFEVNARSTLENAGLIVSEVNKEFNDEYDVNIVFNQMPAANTEIAEGSNVVLYVSKGKDTIMLPNLVGKTEEAARAELTKLGLPLTSVKYEVSTEYEKGLVIAQSPGANKLVEKTQGITLVISKGKVSTKSITIKLSELVPGAPRAVVVRVDTIGQEGNPTTQYQSTHQSNEIITVSLKGVGVEYYKIYIDNTEAQSGVITF